MRDVMHGGRLVPTMVRTLIQIDDGECDTTKELASHMKGRIAWWSDIALCLKVA